VIVVKFGGTSVGDAAAIQRTAEIVKSRIDRDPIVVVSALGGATNALLAVAEQLFAAWKHFATDISANVKRFSAAMVTRSMSQGN
jgi:aspartate kinase